MEAKGLVDTLAEGLAEMEVKRVGDTLVKVESYGEASQTTREQGRRVVEKVDKLGETLAKKKAERLVDTLSKRLPRLPDKTLVHTLRC